MTVTLPAELETFVANEVASGRFANESELLIAALAAMKESPAAGAPVYPAGSLLHLYTSEANEEERRTIAGNSLRVEDW